MSDVSDAAASSPSQSEQRDLSGKVCGDFRILRKLGQGGMGQVYLAEQISLKRKVALKLLKPELAANKIALERFKREAESVARATHAHIVQIYAIGEADGLNYMALEYVEGRNLREFIERKGSPDVPLGLRIIGQVASALQAASELGVVHRDIKPENILITRRGEVKVADFGLSRHFKQASDLTESRIAMGTPLYMSPEQVEGNAVDHRTDIYSLGVTCYHLFAGHPPFKGQTPFEVALQHVNKEARPIAEIRPDLPAELCGLIHKMMAKKPEARYQTGREIVRDVNKLRDGILVSGGTLAMSGFTQSATMLDLGTGAVDGFSTTVVGRMRPRSRPFLFAGVVTLMLAGGLAAGWFLTPRPSVAVPMPAHPPDGKSADPPMVVKELFSQAEREKDQQRKVQEFLKGQLDLGLEPIMNLGAIYLRERKLDEADAYFKEIASSQRRVTQYKTIATFGKAMTLAFRDQPAESNKLFLEAFEYVNSLEQKADAVAAKNAEPKKLGPRPNISGFWQQNVAWREQMAQALHRNFVNAPDAFPGDKYMQEFSRSPIPNGK